MTDIRHTILPTATTVAPRMLLRRTFHPYGKRGHSFSVTLRDEREGPTYLLTMRAPGDKLPTPLFEGKVILDHDLDETAAEVLETLTHPPDEPGVDFSTYSPEQLDFAIHHARVLRECVHQRLRWNTAEKAPRLAVSMDYHKRAVGDLRHRITSGVVDVAAHTRKDVKAAFEDAIRNHLSAIPAFAKNGEGSIYALFPRGAEWVIQVLNPQLAEWLGPVHTFAARTPEEAETELARVVNAVAKSAAPARKSSGKLRSSGPVIGIRA
jgi:hypothetical protein